MITAITETKLRHVRTTHLLWDLSGKVSLCRFTLFAAGYWLAIWSWCYRWKWL